MQTTKRKSSPQSCIANFLNLIWFFIPNFKGSDRIFLLGQVFFLTNFDFLTSHFWRKFVISSELHYYVELKFQKSLWTCDHFSLSYGRLKIVNLANLEQLTPNLCRAIHAYAEINPSQKPFQIGLRHAIWTNFVPTFDTKVTEYLCSGWVFFFRQISTF